jgi:hypothetical protein
MPNFCQNCGSPLKPGLAYCEICGEPIPVQPPGTQPVYPSQPQVPQTQKNYVQPPPPPSSNYPPLPPRPPSSGGGWRKTLIILGVLLVLSLCFAIAGVVAMIASGVNSWNQIEALIPTNMRSLVETAVPGVSLEPSDLQTLIPDLTLEPSGLLTALPFQESPPPPTPKAGLTSFLVDNSSEWKVVDTDQYHTDTSQPGIWTLGVKKPRLTVAVLPPGQPDKAVTSVTIKFKLITDTPFAMAGVRCILQDKDNYYQVALMDQSFAISKVLNGTLTPLTSPYWRPSHSIGPEGLMGGASIEVNCSPTGLTLSVNGNTEIGLVPNPGSSFGSGRVAVFSGSGDNLVKEFYALATFGNFTIEPSK